MVPLKALPLLYFVVCAVAMPKIPLSKRNDILVSMKRDGVLDNIRRIKMEIANTKRYGSSLRSRVAHGYPVSRKLQAGLEAIEKNTGHIQ
jgi:hypothetical protein